MKSHFSHSHSFLLSRTVEILGKHFFCEILCVSRGLLNWRQSKLLWAIMGLIVSHWKFIYWIFWVLQNVTIFGYGVFKKAIKFKRELLAWRFIQYDWYSYRKEIGIWTQAQRETTGRNRETVSCKQRRKVSEEITLEDNLILVFKPLELWKWISVV